MSPCLDGREHEDSLDDTHMRQGGELLCALMRRFGHVITSQAMASPALLAWWDAHKLRDARKAERGW